MEIRLIHGGEHLIIKICRLSKIAATLRRNPRIKTDFVDPKTATKTGNLWAAKHFLATVNHNTTQTGKSPMK